MKIDKLFFKIIFLIYKEYETGVYASAHSSQMVRDAYYDTLNVQNTIVSFWCNLKLRFFYVKSLESPRFTVLYARDIT